MQKNTEDVPACMRLEVIYVLLHLHDLVVILSTKRGNRFIQILEPSPNVNTNQSSRVRLTVIERRFSPISLYMPTHLPRAAMLTKASWVRWYWDCTWEILVQLGEERYIFYICCRPRPPSHHNNIPDVALGVAIDHTLAIKTKKCSSFEIFFFVFLLNILL